MIQKGEGCEAKSNTHRFMLSFITLYAQSCAGTRGSGATKSCLALALRANFHAGCYFAGRSGIAFETVLMASQRTTGFALRSAQ